MNEAIEEYDNLGHRKVWRAASVGSDFNPLYGGFSNIVYHPDNIYGKKGKNMIGVSSTEAEG